MNPLTIDGAGRIEAFHSQIVHLVVEVEGRRMADPTLPLPEEDLLAQVLLLRRLGEVQRPERRQLRGGGEVEHVLHLRHHGHLAGAVGEVDAFFGGGHLIAVEVGGALFELGEILHGPERPLGAVDLLIEHAAQADGVDAETRGLRAVIRVEVEGRVGVAVGVAIQAGDAQALGVDLAVVGLVELLLGEGRQQQPQALHLDGRQDPIHDGKEVLDRQQLPLRDIAQLRPGGQEEGGRKLRQQMVRQIKVGVKARAATALPACRSP